ncbi:PucR family transcriptional regulator [Mycobacterium branderi]|nr:PucR family transcriptional regulator [Mycobacterium branderi]
MDTNRDEFVTDLVDVTKLEIRALNHDTRMTDLLTASITEVVVAGIHYLDLEAPQSRVQAPPGALFYARALAQRDVPLSALIRAYRIGHARFLEAAMRYASSLEGVARVPTIVELVNRTARFIDQVCDQVGVAYEQERDRWVSRRSGLRQQWVGQLLAGLPVDIQRAEEVLRYRFDGTHLAAVAWADVAVPTRDVATLLDRVGRLVAAELGAIGRPLMVHTDEREVRVWLSVPAPVVLDRSRVRAAFDSSGIAAYVAFGDTDAGLDGFRRSLKQAERVQSVVLGGGASPPSRVSFYAEVAPVALMAGDLEELRRFVADALGDLGLDDDRNRWLRETLREFLVRNRSYVATAEAMILHRNTIQYRVTQAMELCGQDFDDPDAVLKVQIALEACRWMARAVLRPAT